MANENEPTNTQPEKKSNKKRTPTAEEMMEKLRSIDIEDFSIEDVTDELKGNRIWISILTVPVSAVLLALFTLLGTFLFDEPIMSFVITALALYWIAKIVEGTQESYVYRARDEIMRRIAAIEEGFGFLPHFQQVLPARYRHLWQSVRRGNYVYIEQYSQAIYLLQNKLDIDKFILIWHLKFPETDPKDENYQGDAEPDEVEEKINEVLNTPSEQQ